MAASFCDKKLLLKGWNQQHDHNYNKTWYLCHWH